MPLFQILLVALIQGITEFLPVSSSAHLILLPELTNLKDQGLTIDVAVHLGTLVAVIVYFWTDVKKLCYGALELAQFKKNTSSALLTFYLIVATAPVVIAGLIIKVVGFDSTLRSVEIIGWAMIVFGIVLYWSDQKSTNKKSFQQWDFKSAVILGLWQALALIPGTSRSGAVISGARAIGFLREDSAKLAMLMSIPTIIASATLVSIEVVSNGDLLIVKDSILAAFFSFITALVTIKLMMRFLRYVSFTPYVIYRIAVGLILLIIAYS
jgi:undecaprenyl-diphosphatase